MTNRYIKEKGKRQAMDNTFFMILSDDATRLAKQREQAAAEENPRPSAPSRQDSLCAAFHRARDQQQDADVLLEIAYGRPPAFDECFMMPGLGYAGPNYEYIALKRDSDLTRAQVRELLHDGDGWLGGVYDLRQSFARSQGARPMPAAGDTTLLPARFAAGLREILYDAHYPDLSLWQKLSHLNRARKEAYKQNLQLL